jgi:AhpD family alkylhydroperoxidase
MCTSVARSLVLALESNEQRKERAMAIEEQNLSSEQKELVAVGASVGAGCHPCVSHHLKAGAQAGLDGEQLLAAVTSAERVTAEAAVLIGDHVRAKLGPTAAAPALLSQLEEALASLGAALGANDAKNIERQMRTALSRGASRSKLGQAIETAQTVQENASRIHVREAERLLDALAPEAAAPQNEAEPDDSCGCTADDEAKAPPRGAQIREPVGQTSDGDTRTNRTSAFGACSTDSMARLFATVRTGEGGCAAAMANCRDMVESAWADQAAPAETNESPTATEVAGSCKKEA